MKRFDNFLVVTRNSSDERLAFNWFEDYETAEEWTLDRAEISLPSHTYDIMRVVATVSCSCTATLKVK